MRSLSRLLLPLVVGCSALASAHPATVPTAVAKVKADGSFQIAIRFDVLAYTLDQESGHVDRSDMAEFFRRPVSEIDTSFREAGRRFLAEFSVRSGKVQDFSFPGSAEARRWQGSNPSVSPVMLTATLKGKLDTGAKAASFRFPERLGSTVLILEFPYREPISGPVEPGSYSKPHRLPTSREVAANAASMLGRRSSGKRSKTQTKPVVKKKKIG